MGEKYVQGSGQKYNDFLKTKKMRNVRTINLAVVSRRDLYYVSENKSFCFEQIFMGEKYFQVPRSWHGTARKILARKNIGTAWHAKSDPFLMGEKYV